jgi:Delta7-sterol 5-desaturase
MHDHPFSLLDAAVQVFPNALMFDGGRYIIATLLMSAILLWVKRTSWAARTLQTRRPAASDYGRELATSARAVLVYGSVGTLTFWASVNGWTATHFHGGAPLTQVLLFTALLLLGHDTYFYWTHRAMHHPKLFKFFHRTHHRSITPTPFTAYAFSTAEAAVQALFVAIWISIIPTPGLAIFLFLGIMIIRNVWGHCGVELHPRGMADHPLGGLITTTTHHDLHHNGSFNHNFGLYFTWWDRLMGTEHPRYREIFNEVTTRTKPRALSPALLRTAGLMLAATAMMSIALPALAADHSNMMGDWITPGSKGRVTIAPCGARLCGRLVWIDQPTDANGAPKRDIHNDDTQLRSRPLVGINLLSDFSLDGASGGHIYNPEDGRSYRSKLSLRSPAVLEVKGCWGPFCKTQLWQRAASPLRSVSP